MGDKTTSFKENNYFWPRFCLPIYINIILQLDMNIRSLVFGLICLISTAVIAQGQKSYKVNAIAFYNVENLFDSLDDPRKDDDDFTPDGKKEWSQGRYEKKIQNLSKVIQSMEGEQGLPWIIGLAEVENQEVVEELGEYISPSNYSVVHHESPDRSDYPRGCRF